MPNNTIGVATRKSLQFLERFEYLTDKFGDPVEAAFKIMKTSRKVSHKLSAISILLSYRYPKLTTARIEVETDGQLEMSWSQIVAEQPAPIPLEAIDAEVVEE